MKSSFIVVVCSVLMTGCGSYRFHSVGETPLASGQPTRQYRIVGLSFDVKRGLNGFNPQNNPFAPPDPWSIVQTASLLNQKDLVEAIKRKNEAVGDNADAVPVEIEIVSQSERKELEATILVPYLVSLGILPAWNRSISSCTIKMTLGIGTARKSYQYECNFISNSKMTAFSPIGIIDYDDIPDAIAQRKASGYAAPHLNPNCLNDLKTVFATTVSKALSASMTRFEAGK